MKTTTDLFSGKPFRYNSTCTYRMQDGSEWVVPQRMTTRSAMWLHPGRVPAKLLAKLNNGRTWPRVEPTYAELLAESPTPLVWIDEGIESDDFPR